MRGEEMRKEKKEVIEREKENEGGGDEKRE